MEENTDNNSVTFKDLLKIKSVKQRQDLLKGLLTTVEQKRLTKMLKFIAMAEEGFTERSMTRTVGVGNSTLKSWLEKGAVGLDECDKDEIDIFEHNDYLYIEFYISFYQHKENYQQKLIKNIEKCGEGEFVENEDGSRVMINKPDWKASKWLLEKNEPDAFADKQEINVKHSGSNGFQGGSIIIPTLGINVSEEEMNKMLEESQKSLIESKEIRKK